MPFVYEFSTRVTWSNVFFRSFRRCLFLVWLYVRFPNQISQRASCFFHLAQNDDDDDDDAVERWIRWWWCIKRMPIWQLLASELSEKNQQLEEECKKNATTIHIDRLPSSSWLKHSIKSRQQMQHTVSINQYYSRSCGVHIAHTSRMTVYPSIY